MIRLRLLVLSDGITRDIQRSTGFPDSEKGKALFERDFGGRTLCSAEWSGRLRRN